MEKKFSRNSKQEKVQKGASIQAKRDINLVTPKKTHEHAARAVAYSLLAVLLLGLTSIVAIWLPKMQLASMERDVMAMNNQMIPYQKAEADFASLGMQKSAVEQILASVKTLDMDYMHPKDMLDMLNETCPDTISLEGISFTPIGIQVMGMAESDTDIAQFMQNLRNTGIFQSVSLQRVSTSEDETDSLRANKRVFDMTMAFPSTAQTAVPSPGNTAQGGVAPMKLSRREKTMIIVGLIIIALVAYMFYFFMPMMNQKKKATVNYNTAQQQLQLLKMKAVGSDKLSKDLDELNAELEAYNQTIPTGISHEQLLLYIKDLTGNTVGDVAINIADQPEMEGSLQRQTVVIECTASYDKLYAFMEALRKNVLYSKPQVLNIDYIAPSAVPTGPLASPKPTEKASGTVKGTKTTHTPTPTPTPTPTVLPTAEQNLLSIHLELYFYAFPMKEGDSLQPVLTPNPRNRQNSLFPKVAATVTP